jgi:hypothetical protein
MDRGEEEPGLSEVRKVGIPEDRMVQDMVKSQVGTRLLGQCPCRLWNYV